MHMYLYQGRDSRGSPQVLHAADEDTTALFGAKRLTGEP